VGSIPTPGTMYGEVITQAPNGFVPYHQWPEYGLAADVPLFLKPRVTGKDPVGMYRRFWPIVIEEYISDKEPVLKDSDPEGIAANRMIIWQRLFRTDAPPQGWRVYGHKPMQLEGFAIVDDANYQARWSESARRYARKWDAQYVGKEFTIEDITEEEFLSHYKHSDIKPYIRKIYAEMVARKRASGAHIRFIGARHLASKDIAAAMAVIDSPTHSGSHYLCGFIKKQYEDVPAMVGLMDAWYAQCLERGIRFLHFGRFWQEGDPYEWKGFSLFKAKFGLHYISYPPALWQFVRGRLF
jgi:hypothetical protein